MASPEEAAEFEAAALQTQRVTDEEGGGVANGSGGGGGATWTNCGPSDQPHLCTRGEPVTVHRAATCSVHNPGPVNPWTVTQVSECLGDTIYEDFRFDQVDGDVARSIAYVIQRPLHPVRNIVILAAGQQTPEGFIGAQASLSRGVVNGLTGQGDDWKMPNSEWSASAHDLRRNSEHASGQRYVHVDSMWSQLRQDPPPELPVSSTLYIAFWDLNFLWNIGDDRREQVLAAVQRMVLDEIARSGSSPSLIRHVMLAGASRGAAFSVRLARRLLDTLANAEVFAALFDPVVAPFNYPDDLPSTTWESELTVATPTTPGQRLLITSTTIAHPNGVADDAANSLDISPHFTAVQRARLTVRYWTHGVVVSGFSGQSRAVMGPARSNGVRIWLQPTWADGTPANTTMSNYCATDTLQDSNANAQRRVRVHAGVACLERDSALGHVSQAFREAGWTQVSVRRVGHTSTATASLACSGQGSGTAGDGGVCSSTGSSLGCTLRCAPTTSLVVTCRPSSTQLVLGVRRQGVRVATARTAAGVVFSATLPGDPSASVAQLECEFANPTSASSSLTTLTAPPPSNLEAM